MLFNSFDFAIFLPLVFTVYWLINRYLRIQNLFIVAVSYLFYGWWDWRFLSLIFFSTLIDYFAGYKLLNEERPVYRKALLLLSISVNLGLLGFFKYFNFFIDNFSAAFSFFGMPIKASGLTIILPVGISFYTFQTMSYTIDVYRKKIQPTKDFIAFSAYVSFFPQLVAGPIERAGNLLPQFYLKRAFNYSAAADGMRQMLWGFFKKLVIADNCAELANLIFEHSNEFSGYVLLLGVLFFTFQIYGDFSGYSDIAIGTARLFGFSLRQNFAFPYFSRDIAEFWRRWHMSLSTWFRDYVYIPLGGSRGNTWTKIRNTFAIFVLSGFWHGANWTFVVWGLLNALYFMPLLLMKKNRTHLEIVAAGMFFPHIRDFLKMVITFWLTVFAWIFFRATSLSHAFTYIQRLYSGIVEKPGLILEKSFWFPYQICTNLILGFLLFEWFRREKPYALHIDPNSGLYRFRWAIYMLVAFVVFRYGNFDKTEFIYFAF